MNPSNRFHQRSHSVLHSVLFALCPSIAVLCIFCVKSHWANIKCCNHLPKSAKETCVLCGSDELPMWPDCMDCFVAPKIQIWHVRSGWRKIATDVAVEMFLLIQNVSLRFLQVWQFLWPTRCRWFLDVSNNEARRQNSIQRPPDLTLTFGCVCFGWTCSPVDWLFVQPNSAPLAPTVFNVAAELRIKPSCAEWLT